jgi:hypothetical protein
MTRQTTTPANRIDQIVSRIEPFARDRVESRGYCNDFGSLRDASARCVSVVIDVVVRDSFAVWKIDVLVE